MNFYLQSQRLVLYGWEKTYKAKDSCLILSIVCGHVLFLFLVVLLLGCFFILFLKKIQKHWKISKKQKYFILCLVLFFLRITWIMISLSWFRTCLTLGRNLNSMYYISAKLFLIFCEYVLVCTCTQGLNKKLIFLVCIPSIA